MKLFGIFRKIKNRPHSESLGHLFGFLLGIAIVAFSSVTIYRQFQKIYQKFGVREDAVQDKDKPVSISFGYEDRGRNFFLISNIVIPVYRDASSFQKIVVDFTIVPSHQHIKRYFWDEHNIHLIYDRLNSHMAPVALDFPLEEEGKSIIKQKVRDEINQLVKDLKIEGEIKEVYIGRILAG